MLGLIRVLSLGAGVQSSTLALMIMEGEVERVDAAIFSDTGWEPGRVYRHLDWLESVLPYPVYRVTNGNLKETVLQGNDRGRKFMPVPYYLLRADGSRFMGRRQCTHEYKLVPLYRKARELAGLRKGQASREAVVEIVIGISFDEAHRMRDPRERWYTNSYPLVEKRMRRSDCLQWLAAHGYPIPPKSSCLGCPYRSNDLWREMRVSSPAEWDETCRIDEFIRDKGTDRGALQYMHRSFVPLRQADVGGHMAELDLFGNECEGMCGV